LRDKKMVQQNHHDELEIFLDDLTPEAQKTVLEFLKLKTAQDGNLDIFPIAIIPKPELEKSIKYRCVVCLSEWLSTTPPKKCPFCNTKADKIEVVREDD
jgi:rubrerythrin